MFYGKKRINAIQRLIDIIEVVGTDFEKLRDTMDSLQRARREHLPEFGFVGLNPFWHKSIETLT